MLCFLAAFNYKWKRLARKFSLALSKKFENDTYSAIVKSAFPKLFLFCFSSIEFFWPFPTILTTALFAFYFFLFLGTMHKIGNVDGQLRQSRCGLSTEAQWSLGQHRSQVRIETGRVILANMPFKILISAQLFAPLFNFILFKWEKPFTLNIFIETWSQNAMHLVKSTFAEILQKNSVIIQ